MPESIPAWIQAIAALAQVGLAFVLWLATSRYVDLTRDLSVAAERQLVLLRHAQEHARRSDLVELAALCGRIRASMDELPQSTETHSWGTALRNAPLWSISDMGKLASLAAKAGPIYAHRLALVANDLEWIRAQLQIVRAENPSLGYAMSSFPWEAYSARKARALVELREVQDLVTNDAAAGADEQ